MQDESMSSQSLQSDDSSDESDGGVIAKKSKESLWLDNYISECSNSSAKFKKTKHYPW